MDWIDKKLTELAKEGPLSIYTLRRKIKRGKLRAHKPGGSGPWIVNRYDWRAFLSGRKPGMVNEEKARVASPTSEKPYAR